MGRVEERSRPPVSVSLSSAAPLSWLRVLPLSSSAADTKSSLPPTHPPSLPHNKPRHTRSRATDLDLDPANDAPPSRRSRVTTKPERERAHQRSSSFFDRAPSHLPLTTRRSSATRDPHTHAAPLASDPEETRSRAFPFSARARERENEDKRDTPHLRIRISRESRSTRPTHPPRPRPFRRELPRSDLPHHHHTPGRRP
jgi:hypothetical protein